MALAVAVAAPFVVESSDAQAVTTSPISAAKVALMVR